MSIAPTSLDLEACVKSEMKVSLPIVLSIMSPVVGGIAGRLGSRLLLGAGPIAVAAGFLLLLRVGAAASYWTDVFPAKCGKPESRA